ncbi:MAG: DsbC/DsbD-like thiol-disulfide interchange protein [Glaciecola sp.]|jgi:DsbC/DsbD-like thiol-disulfide interchange protein
MAIRSNFAHALLMGVFLALALPVFAQEGLKGTQPVEALEIPTVQVSTLFDVKDFVPGQMAHLVVLLDVPKDRHIFWANPGSSGKRTAVTVTGPEGWKVLAPRFPGPVLHKSKAGEVTYILKDKVAFFVPILPPDNAKVGQQVEFDLQAEWQIAKQDRKSESVPFQSVRMKIRANVAGGLPVRNSDRTIAAMRSSLPRRGAGPTGVGISLSGDAKEGDLTFHSLDAREFEFFAYPDSPMVVEARNSESKSASRSMHNFHLKSAQGKTPKEIAVNGVLRVKTRERVFYYEVQYKGVLTIAPPEIQPGHGSLPELPKKTPDKR